MNRTQFAAIKEIIHHIDDQLQESLHLEELAKQAGISKYHLHHLFKAVTGKSVMTYVRDRKLSRSIDLLSTNLNIIDIASNYHFEHEQSYIRAFKQKFCMPTGKLGWPISSIENLFTCGFILPFFWSKLRHIGPWALRWDRLSRYLARIGFTVWRACFLYFD